MTTSAYQQMTREAERIGFPRFFKTDLTIHDRDFLLRSDCPKQFGWLLRECGTDILLPNYGFALLAYWGQRTEVRWYWFDGGELRPTTPQEIKKLLEQQVEEDGQGQRT